MQGGAEETLKSNIKYIEKSDFYVIIHEKKFLVHLTLKNNNFRLISIHHQFCKSKLKSGAER